MGKSMLFFDIRKIISLIFFRFSWYNFSVQATNYKIKMRLIYQLIGIYHHRLGDDFRYPCLFATHYAITVLELEAEFVEDEYIEELGYFIPINPTNSQLEKFFFSFGVALDIL